MLPIAITGRRTARTIRPSVSSPSAGAGFAFDPVPHSGGDNSGYVSLAYGLLADGAYVDVFDPAPDAGKDG